MLPKMECQVLLNICTVYQDRWVIPSSYNTYSTSYHFIVCLICSDFNGQDSTDQINHVHDIAEVENTWLYISIQSWGRMFHIICLREVWKSLAMTENHSGRHLVSISAWTEERADGSSWHMAMSVQQNAKLILLNG